MAVIENLTHLAFKMLWSLWKLRLKWIFPLKRCLLVSVELSVQMSTSFQLLAKTVDLISIFKAFVSCLLNI